MAFGVAGSWLTGWESGRLAVGVLASAGSRTGLAGVEDPAGWRLASQERCHRYDSQSTTRPHSPVTTRDRVSNHVLLSLLGTHLDALTNLTTSCSQRKWPGSGPASPPLGEGRV